MFIRLYTITNEGGEITLLKEEVISNEESKVKLQSDFKLSVLNSTIFTSKLNNTVYSFHTGRYSNLHLSII